MNINFELNKGEAISIPYAPKVRKMLVFVTDKILEKGMKKVDIAPLRQ